MYRLASKRAEKKKRQNYFTMSNTAKGVENGLRR